MPMAKLLRFFRHSLTRRDKIQLLFLFALILFQALLDVLGVATVFPLISIIANQELIQSNAYLAFLYDALGFGSDAQFIIFIALAMFALVLVSNVFKSFTAYRTYLFSHLMECELGTKLMRYYLAQNYERIVSHNTIDYSKNILSETGQVVKGVILASIQFVAQLLTVIGLLALLIFVDWRVTLTVAASLGGIFWGIYVVARPFITLASERRVKENARRYLVVDEAFSGIKAVKAGALELTYLMRFIVPARQYAYDQTTAATFSTVPKFILETISFGGILGLLFFLIWTMGGILEALPIIAVYAFAVYRLLPAVQQMYRSLTMIKAAQPSLAIIEKDLDQNLTAVQLDAPSSALTFNRGLELRNAAFSYDSSVGAVIRGVSVMVAPGEVIGFAGQTGSGKTTTADILLGILTPQDGGIFLDDREISGMDDLRGSLSGYVPQKIFLADDTIAANIAFGLAPGEIDHQRVEEVARLAQIHDFITTQMPDGYQSRLGEDGVRISGGQRQRIGIARALYRGPKLLVLDEATSALDPVTEKMVMRSITPLKSHCAIIIIAHRMDTLKACDRIYVFDKGRTIDSGSFDELAARNNSFKALISANPS